MSEKFSFAKSRQIVRNTFFKTILVGVPLLTTLVLFQNCSSSFDAQGNTPAPVSAGNNNQSSTATNATPVPKPALLTIDHGSIANAYGITRFVMRVSGAGSSEVRACTALVSAYSTHCTKDSDFVLLRSVEQWSYNAATDTYSVDQDVSSRGFPNVDYFTKYILPGGQRIENRWHAITFLDSSVGNGLVFTRLTQTISGIGAPGLRGCAGTMADYAKACRNDSDFVVVTGQEGWSYNPLGDLYSINIDASGKGFPYTQYFSRYILPNGLRTEVLFSPRR